MRVIPIQLNRIVLHSAEKFAYNNILENMNFIEENKLISYDFILNEIYKYMSLKNYLAVILT